MNKVVILAPTPPPAGGIAGWTMRMLQANLKNDWIVEVVDEKLLGGAETFGEGNKRHISDEIKRTLGIWRNLRIKLKDSDVKVIHSCIPSTTLAMIREYICARITHFYKRPFIIHFRCTTPNTTKGRLGEFFLKKLCKVSDYVLVLNNLSLKHISRICDTPTEVIPNFVDVSEIYNDYEVNETVKTVLYVGGVIESKGCMTICKMAGSFPDIEFRLVGKAEKSIIDAASKCNNVVLTGPKDKADVKEELKSADIFLFLSHFRGEGFSNSLAEAMAFGLPCIVTDWAANADMIEDKGGIIVQVDSLEDAKNALVNEFDFKKRKQQALFNIKKITSVYTSDVVLDKYVNCYELVCSN